MIRRFNILLLLVLLSSCASVRRQGVEQGLQGDALGSRETSYLYLEGVKAQWMGDGRAAQELFEQVVAIDSTHGAAMFELAGLLAPHDVERAGEYARRASALEPDNEWYRMREARLLVFERKYVQAQQAYRQLTERHPDNPENYRMLAALLQQQGEPYHALGVIEKARERLGESVPLLQLQANLYRQVGQDSLAMRALDQALLLDPENEQALFDLAACYRSARRTDDFFATAHRIVTSRQVAVEHKIELIDELQANRPFYQAHFFAVRDLIMALIALYPDNWEAIERYGMALAATGGVEQSLDYFKGRLTADSIPISLFHSIIEMESYLQRPDSVARYADLALQHYPDDFDLRMRLAGSQLYLERYPEAMKGYRDLSRRASTDSLRSVLLGAMGDLLHTTSRPRQAYRLYRLALRADSNNVLVLNNFAYWLATDSTRLEELPRAIEMARRATILESGNPTYLDTYAWALYRAGRLEEAQQAMRQAISLDPDTDPTLSHHYADILCALGQKLLARLYYQKALDKSPGDTVLIRKLERLKLK